MGIESELPTDPNFWVAVILAISTATLAVITYFYMRETKGLRTATEKMVTETANIRKASQQPIFALEPDFYISGHNEIPGEKFLKINLVNHGAPATDIIADCGWFDSEGSSGSSRSFYIISLARDGYAGLAIEDHLGKIIKEKKFVRVKIQCKDAAGNAYETVITNGLDKIRGTETKMAYQNNHSQTIYQALDNIYRKLGEIDRKIK